MLLHPQTAAFMAVYNASAPAIDFDTVTAAELRSLFSIPKPVTVSAGLRGVEDRTVDGPAGPIGLRLYRPQADGALPLTLFIHGGGFCIGDVDTTDALCRILAEEAGSLVVSVDYRRAPEAPFPAGLDDCWAALKWLSERGGEIGGDPFRIAVAGNSSGGNFAAVLAHRATNEGLQLRHQVLLFPGKHPAGTALLWSGRGIEDVLTAARKDVRSDHAADDDIDGAGASASLER